MSSTPYLQVGDTANILAELKKISKILLLANARIIEDELSKITNSDARKKLWVLIDGTRMPKDLAEKAKVTRAAVSYFLDAASAAGLIEYTERSPPRRILDYVPAAWLQLVISEEHVEVAQPITAEKASTKQSDTIAKGGKQ
ncbi:MAG: hypothetical protein ACFCUE_10960 [Candidatus Bathyarchaeia archaeon]|jgi:predicted transcriptional regulator